MRSPVSEFLSDNSSGLCPEALEAITGSRGGRAVAYGDDAATGEAVELLRAMFGEDTDVFFVATGTAANTLALASLTDRRERILCEEYAHLANDESTGPEQITGCRIVTVPAGGRKLRPEDLQARDATLARGVHHPVPGVVTVSNPTELGEVYRPSELRELVDESHRLGYRFHVDGARFANAVAALGCDPKDLTVDVGVDAMTFGGTKNGLALGEAVLFFDGPGRVEAARRFPYLRKATGHLLSKHRYVSAPFAAVLADGAWLRHAAHANAMAARLSRALEDAGLAPRFATDANGVFVALPGTVRAGLVEKGWSFHTVGDPNWGMARFMTSFDTTAPQVDRLAADVAAGTP
jgi:threonine aldolase